MYELSMYSFILYLIYKTTKRSLPITYIEYAARYVKRKIKEKGLDINFNPSMKEIVRCISNDGDCLYFENSYRLVSLSFGYGIRNKRLAMDDDDLANIIDGFVEKYKLEDIAKKAEASFYNRSKQVVKRKCYMKWLNEYITKFVWIDNYNMLLRNNATYITNILMLNALLDMVRNYSLFYLYEYSTLNGKEYFSFKYEGKTYMFSYEYNEEYNLDMYNIAFCKEEAKLDLEDVLNNVVTIRMNKRRNLINYFKELLKKDFVDEIPKKYLISVINKVYEK